eukprot:COSAG02_NODE_1631_length_11575_cov_5.514639_11_plen_76_part_00
MASTKAFGLINSNDAPLQGEMFGTVYMHAVGIKNEDAVGAYKMSMATALPGLAFNLFSRNGIAVDMLRSLTIFEK